MMINGKLRGAVAVLALLAASLACGVSASTANVRDAYLARDPEGSERVDIFFADETFYLIVDLANAPDDTSVRAVWTAVDADGVELNTLIDEAALESGDGRVTFDLSNDSLWPEGNYKVDLYLNEKLERTLEFSVET
jgi:hypothetical protein